MGDPRWLRVITVGLFLASLAVAYFLLTGQLTSKSVVKTQSQVSKSNNTVTPSPQSSATISSSTPTPSPSPESAYDRIAQRNQDLQTLPRTGTSLYWLIIVSLAATSAGLGLRKYPH